MSQLTPLEREILQACSEDDVGLWEAVWLAQDEFPEASADEIREIVLSALRMLLAARLIDAGRSVARGKSYDIVSWNLSAEKSIERICREWDQLGCKPKIGDIVWFVSTTEGERVLTEGRERNVLKESDS